MGNDLHRLAKIIATALVREDGLVDLTARQIVLTSQDTLGKALIMSEIEIRLGPVGQHINLPVLERIHRSRIDIQIGIKLLKRHPESTSLQQRSKRSSGQPLAERTHHTTRHENVFHGSA